MSATEAHSRRRALEPHPALWEAFDRGALLRTILIEFYERVYRDPRLAPFFVNTTKAWAIDHQYAFLRQILTGEDCYFGDRPRNAHHWMVISNELFDYREALMAQVLREHGLSEALIADFRRIDESFRANIVKSAPFPRKRNGVAMPLEGWKATAMSAGGICDRCAAIVEIDATAWYHLRTGETRCSACAHATGVDDEAAASDASTSALAGAPT
ncbi:MAG: group 1 truncated hemoglobin [Kofleriaceae bacterium]